MFGLKETQGYCTKHVIGERLRDVSTVQLQSKEHKTNPSADLVINLIS